MGIWCRWKCGEGVGVGCISPVEFFSKINLFEKLARDLSPRIWRISRSNLFSLNGLKVLLGEGSAKIGLVKSGF